MNKLMTAVLLFAAMWLRAEDFTGNNLLRVLGKPSSSPDFNAFRNFWLLDKKLESSYGGLKVILNARTNSIDTVLVAGVGYTCCGTGFMPCTSPLPFGLQLNDPKEVMAAKMQGAFVAAGKNYLIEGAGVSALIAVKESQTVWIKFFPTDGTVKTATNNKPVAEVKQESLVNTSVTVSHNTPVTTLKEVQPVPAKASAETQALNNHSETTLVEERPVNARWEAMRRSVEEEAFNSNAATNAARIPAAYTAEPVVVKAENKVVVKQASASDDGNDRFVQTRREVEQRAFDNQPSMANGVTTQKTNNPVVTTANLNQAVTTAKSNSNDAVAVSEDPTLKNASAFKRAIMDVFFSYRQSAFSSIKTGNRSSGNFWNYKYTYATKLKIPGEKFNMLYSFPFPTSQLDFVSVLVEGDSYDANFTTVYKQMEKRLMENFPSSEGWVTSCLPNKESGLLSDLEVKNEKYGSIVLDYSKSPKGRHVLYLRFLLYSN